MINISSSGRVGGSHGQGWSSGPRNIWAWGWPDGPFPAVSAIGGLHPPRAHAQRLLPRPAACSSTITTLPAPRPRFGRRGRTSPGDPSLPPPPLRPRRTSPPPPDSGRAPSPVLPWCSMISCLLLDMDMNCYFCNIVELTLLIPTKHKCHFLF